MKKPTDPVHPGVSLKKLIKKLRLNVTEAAEQLGVARITLSRVINENAGISAEMAIRLQQWLINENGPSAEQWVTDQATYDLWLLKQNFKDVIRPAKTKETEE